MTCWLCAPLPYSGPVRPRITGACGGANAIAKTREAFGPVDILVNNAAYTAFIPVKDFPIRKWFRSAAVNIHGPFMMSQKVLPDMIERGGGAIVNISSGSAIGPGPGPYKEPSAPGHTMYGAEKAAIERFSQGLAEEVYQYGISVTSLAPSGMVNTPGTKYLGTSDGPDDPRGEPVEYMARAALVLVTEPLDKITGHVTYSQAILKEYGLITKGKGPGIDQPGSGFSQM